MSANLSEMAPSVVQFLMCCLGRCAAPRLFGGIIVLAAWAAASSGEAEGPRYLQYDNGDVLYRECTGEPDARSRCLAYVTGVADMLAAAVARGDVTIACVPADVTADQARDVVVSFLRDNPQSRLHAAASLVEWALGDAYPCRW